MASDSERREVAENLRYLADYPGAPVRYAEQFRDELSAVVLPDGFTHDYSELIQRLAGLIEPAPTSSDRGPTPDPTERGIDSIYDWCFERLEGADGAEDYMLCSIMSAIEEYRHPERVTARTARPVDRDALLALTDGIVDAVRDSSNIGIEGKFAEAMRKLARDIRELCGEEDS